MAALSPQLAQVAQQVQAQEAAVEGLIAALNATGEAALDLAEARQTSNACRDALAQLRSTVDTFELALATDQALEPDAPPVAAATAELLRMRATHDRLRAATRDASLVAFKTSRDAAAKERNALLASSHGQSDRGAMDAQQAAAEATSSLRRTRALMAAELGRGEATMHVQSGSFAALRRTKEEFDSQRATLDKGKKSLGTLTRAAHADRLVLWIGTAFFCCVVLHISLKRVPFLTPLHPLVIARRWRGAAAAAVKHQGAVVAPPAVGVQPASARHAPEAAAPPLTFVEAEAVDLHPAEQHTHWTAAPEPVGDVGGSGQAAETLQDEAAAVTPPHSEL